MTGGLGTFISNVVSMFTTSIGAQIVLLLFIVSAIHDAVRGHFSWLPVVALASTFILGAAWYMNTWYGVTVTTTSG